MSKLKNTVVQAGYTSERSKRSKSDDEEVQERPDPFPESLTQLVIRHYT